MKKLFLFLLMVLFIVPWVHADERQDKENEIAALEKKVSELKGQVQTLAGQIAYYDSQIQLTALKISQTENQILTLTGKIESLEDKLQERSKLLQTQIVHTYKNGGIDPVLIMFSSENVSQLVSRFKYLQIVQDNNRKFLHDTQLVQANYSSQKELIASSQKKLETQKQSLSSVRAQRDALLAQTKNSEVEYQKQLENARRELAAIQNFVNAQGGATILHNQTKCDAWGCYYNQRDAEWGNIGLGGSNLSTAAYGCLVSSSAMVATHYGKSLKPIDIAVSSDAFFSPNKNTALLWNKITVKGITVNRTSYGKNIGVLDSELAAGRPVIVGLYSGPGHFIVIKKKEGDKYIMHDPFAENGHDMAFTDKYSISDITDVEKVSIF